jgi:hypothetical protein
VWLLKIKGQKKSSPSDHSRRAFLKGFLASFHCFLEVVNWWSKSPAPQPLEMACFQRRNFRFVLVSQHTF